MKNYYEGNDVQYIENVYNLYNDRPFLPQGMKIEKVEELVVNFYDKKEYVKNMRNLKQAQNYGLVSKKVHRVIQINENVWLKSHIDMDKELRKKAKTDFEKDFFKLMKNAVFKKPWKVWENKEI